jgi:hypothetical protein
MPGCAEHGCRISCLLRVVAAVLLHLLIMLPGTLQVKSGQCPAHGADNVHQSRPARWLLRADVVCIKPLHVVSVVQPGAVSSCLGCNQVATASHWLTSWLTWSMAHGVATAGAAADAALPVPVTKLVGHWGA